MIKSEQMSEKEYVEQLIFCAEHEMFCFEYHQRCRNKKGKKASDRNRVWRVVPRDL